MTSQCGRGRGHCDLRCREGDGSLDVSRAIAAARRHSARDREWGVGRRKWPSSRRRRPRKSCTGATMTEARTDPDLLYVGTYTENIYLVRMDRRSGELVQVGMANAGANPSFLSMHPDRRVLYAVNERDQAGGVTAFAIERATGMLTKLNEQPSE